MGAADSFARAYGATGGGGGASGSFSRAYGTAPAVSSAQGLARRPQTGGGGHFGQLGGFFRNLAGNIEETVRGFPGGAATVGKAAWADTRNNVSLIDILRGERSEVVENVAKPAARQYRYMYGPLLGGDLGEFGHRLYEDPLGPILDIATIASAGAGGAAKAGQLTRAGTLGEAAATGRALAPLRRYSESLEQPRMIEVRPGEGLDPRMLEVRKARTPYGRALNNLVDMIGTRRQEMPLIGNIRREQKIEGRRLHQLEGQRIAAVRQFERSARPLNQNEKFAFHLAFEVRDPTAAFADAYRVNTETPSRQLQKYMERLAGKRMGSIEKVIREGGDPMADSPVAAAVKAPSETLLNAVARGKELQESGGDVLERAGILTPEIREARRWLAQRLESGARYRSREDIAAMQATVAQAQRQIEGEAGRVTKQMRGMERKTVMGKEVDALARRAARLSDIRFKRQPNAAKAERVRGLLERQVNILGTLQARHAAGEIGEGKLGRAQDRAGRLQQQYDDLASDYLTYKQAQAEGLQVVARQATTEAERRTAVDAQQQVLDEMAQELGRYDDILARLEGTQQALAESAPGLRGGTPIGELRRRRQEEIAGRREAAVAPEFGLPSRFPHEATKERENVLTALERRAPTKEPGVPGSTKKNQGVRLLSARLLTEPTILSRDYLRTMAYQGVLDYWDFLKGYAKPLDPDGLGSPDDGWVYFRMGDAPIPRQAREATPLARDIYAADVERGERALTEKQIERLSKDIVWGKNENPSSGWNVEKMRVEEMTEAGIMQIPERYAKSFLRETKNRNEFLRKFFDRPLDIWRAIVLTYRPAWLVNNIVGQNLLYTLNYMGPAGAMAYLQALRLEKGDEPIRLLGKWTVAHKPRSKWAKVLEEVAPGYSFGAFFRSQDLGTGSLYMGEGRVGRHVEKAMEKGKLSPTRAAYKGLGMFGGAVRSFGDAMNWINLHVADDLPRRAAFIREADRSVAIKNIRRQAKEFDNTNLSLADALRKADTKTIDRAIDDVNRALGNFAALGPIERNYIRRIAPFYSWFKTITTIAGNLALDSPGRILVLQKLAEISQEDGIGLPAGPMPSYLEGAIPLGPREGNEQTLLSTMAVNPFETTLQLAEAGKSLVPFMRTDPETGEADPRARGMGSIFGMLNPLVGALAASQGTDLFYGGPYRGPGAGRGPIAQGVGYFSGLPQLRLAEQLGAYGDYQSTLYNPDYRVAGIPPPVWSYLGFPVRRVRLSEARSRARAGQ